VHEREPLDGRNRDARDDGHGRSVRDHSAVPVPGTERLCAKTVTWCLMTNDYHFVVRIPQNGLSQGMSELNGSFGRWSNRRHGRCDHVFGRRFSAREIVSDAHLLEACRYVVLNPVRAGLCTHPAEWRWSSYRACAGLPTTEPFFARDALLDLVGSFYGTTQRDTYAAYRDFVEAGMAYDAGGTVPGTGTAV
jgi:putative transposase